jgi:hypothetical protein
VPFLLDGIRLQACRCLANARLATTKTDQYATRRSTMLALAETPVHAQPPRIVNHDIMGCTAEGVTGNHLYSSRALGMTEPLDIIQLHPDLEKEWPFIIAHYRRIGLSFTEQVIWHVRHRSLAEHPGLEPSVFYFGAAEQEARPDSSWFRVVDFINSKNNFVELADTLKVPIPKTLCFEDVTSIGEPEIAKIEFPCYLKASISVSGVGIYRCGSAEELREALGRFEPGTPVQAQAEIITNTFLNMQYEVNARGYVRLAATEQVLDGPVHQGNRYPASHEPWDSVEPMAEWLWKEGIRGIFAFDVAVIDKPGGPDYLAIECNPRYNGASYPTAIAHKLGIRHWIARTVKTAQRSLANVDLGGLEYNPLTGQGVILVNWGPILVGKLLVLLAGPPAVQQRLALELQARL